MAKSDRNLWTVPISDRIAGEADRLLWLFTREMGKVKAVAKGVRKMRSRKAGHLEPQTRVNLLLARGRDILLQFLLESTTLSASGGVGGMLLGVLAAGAIRPESGFKYAFANGADFICVGMFDFQVAGNATLVTKVLRSAENRDRGWMA